MKTTLTILVAVVALPALGANGLTVGSLTLIPTHENISVEAKWSGDDNADATAVVEFKASASVDWMTAHAPYMDRRPLIGSNTNATHSNECRVSIVGLLPATAYDVRVTWTDPDGVTGSNPITASTTNQTWTPPLGGTTIYVDSAAGGGGDGSSGAPFNTISDAVTAASAGDTVKLKGTFGATTITKSGTAAAWIKFEKWDAALWIGSVASTTGLTITGDYLWFAGFGCIDSGTNSILISATSDFVFLESLTFTNSTTGANIGSAVSIAAGASFVWVRNCSFTRTSTGGQAYGVYWRADGNQNGGHVIADNTLNGDYRDAIGGEGNGWGDGPVANSDICRNVIVTTTNDDGIECEGENRNVRVYANTIRKGGGSGGALAIAGNHVGPLWVYRNTVQSTNLVAVKLGNNAPGPAFLYHNVFYATGASGTRDALSDVGGDPKSDNFTYRNNILAAARYTIYRGGRTNSYDYNCHWRIGSFVCSEFDATNNFATVAALTAAYPSQEANGMQADPLVDADTLLISSTSPAKDSGVVIPQFNDSASAWRFAGTAPDIGANEVTVTGAATGDSGKARIPIRR